MTVSLFPQTPSLRLQAPMAAQSTPAADGDAEIRFRAYRLLPGARMLLRNGQAIELGGRAFDLLHVLAAARGAVVPRAEIVSHVWPTTLVEESNLRYQVALLRKVLGADRDLIKTIAGRGYLLASDCDASDSDPVARDPTARDSMARDLEGGSAAGELLGLAPWSPRSLLLRLPNAGHVIPGSLGPSAEAHRALGYLLRAALDELAEITQSYGADIGATPPAANANA